jgi:hypothetical protein
MNKPRLAKKYLHHQLIIQLVIFTAVFVVVTSIVGYDVVKGHLGLFLALIGILAGAAIGFFFANRMFVMRWNEDTQKIILGKDKASLIFIGLYIVLRLASKSLMGDFVSGAALTYFTLSTLGGIMLGRLLGMIRAIEKILAEKLG